MSGAAAFQPIVSDDVSLARPVWSALAGDHARFAVGDALARRYPPEIGPLAAARDGSPEARAALGELIRRTGTVMTLQAQDEPAPPGTRTLRRREGVQMVLGDRAATPVAAAIIALEDGHAGAMLALARLTEPGPFGPRTRELGKFLGILADGELVAMAGQRTRFAGFVEISAVCTNPAYRGRGHAAALIRAAAAAIRAEERTPFLQSYADNAGALAVYRRLGFVEHARVWLTTLEAEGQCEQFDS